MLGAGHYGSFHLVTAPAWNSFDIDDGKVGCQVRFLQCVPNFPARRFSQEEFARVSYRARVGIWGSSSGTPRYEGISTGIGESFLAAVWVSGSGVGTGCVRTSGL